MEQKRIILTGGGTAGHVTPNLALLPGLKRLGFEPHYVGGVDGIEKELAAQQGIPYYGISAGKLRRYLSVKNVTDVFRVAKGVSDAHKILKDVAPAAVFSKGGFVTVPVVLAARSLGVPVVLHESDMTPGLANRIAMPFAAHICVTFPETAAHTPAQKTTVTGAPVRMELLAGSRLEGLRVCGFDGARPVLLVIGGSLGSAAINAAVRAALSDLAPHYDVAHICGKGNVDAGANQIGYRQFEYVTKELPHLLAMANLVVSRAGSAAINELLALAKPNILIPLPLKASRGDQIQNARSFAERGFSVVLDESELTSNALAVALHDLYQDRGKFIGVMRKNAANTAVDAVLRVIHKAAWPTVAEANRNE